jgi:predicted PurR-regulated permease PerM
MKNLVRIDTFLKWLLVLLFGSIFLYLGKILFMPLAFALLISLVLYPVCKWLERHHFSRLAAIFLSLSIIVLLVAAVVVVLIKQTIQFADMWPEFVSKLRGLLDEIRVYLTEVIHIQPARQEAWIQSITSDMPSSILNIIQGTIIASSVSLVLILLIPLYSGLMLYHRKMLLKAFLKLFPDYKSEEVGELISHAVHTFYDFIKGMILVYLAVGILNSIGLVIIGVPNPIFFGFVASILTFIPYIGITIGAIIPATIAWIQYDSFLYPLGVITVFTIVQILEANVIFPFAVGNRLHINTLVTLIVIIAGGVIWGVAGMILFVPYVAILKLIADKAEGMETVSILLGPGETGKEEKK